jgi:16S rRNA (cytidine1402-2'-O)-methyltransferase
MTIESACEKYSIEEPRGEYVLVVAGKDPQEILKEKQDGFRQLSIEEHMAQYLDAGMDRKEAMKKVAKDRGISKREVYQIINT